MARFLAMVSLALLASFARADERLIGTWELVGLSPAFESRPGGRANLKARFADDGTVALVRPDRTLAGGATEGRWELDGERLALELEGERRVSTAEFRGANEMLLLSDGLPTELYRRLDGPDAIDRRIEPKSLHVMASGRRVARATSVEEIAAEIDEPSPTVPGPEGASDEERLVGVWETILHRDPDEMGIPPGGFQNDLYVFDAERMTMILRAPETKAAPALRWTLREGLLEVSLPAGQSAPLGRMSFDEWGHLHLRGGPYGGTTVLRRVGNDPRDVPELPLRIVVLERGG